MSLPDLCTTIPEGEDCPQIEYLKMEDGENADNDDHSNHSDNESVASDESDDSPMEPFEDYKLKIQQLLEDIGLTDFSIEPIQHGYGYMNCVYALTSLQDPTEQYILRVAIDGFIRESDGRHETIENDIVLLGYLKDKLPVPRIKAYSTTEDDVLNKAYTIQTRIPGESLDNLWKTMDYADKYAIVDEFRNLFVKVESVRFATAGTFASSAPLAAKANDYSDTEEPAVNVFDALAEEPLVDPEVIRDRAGPDVKSLLTSHLDKWIQDERDRGQHEFSCSITPRFEKLKAMLQDMANEGSFKDQPFSIVLHHWDLEPRNLMVSKASGAWRICGIIDWDDALALPTPLARVPPRWIWHFPDEEPGLSDGHLTDDQFRDPELSEEDRALKMYWDKEIEAVLPGYCEDAYGRGRWLRRIWFFAKEGTFRQWQWPFLDQIPEEWAEESKQ